MMPCLRETFPLKGKKKKKNVSLATRERYWLQNSGSLTLQRGRYKDKALGLQRQFCRKEHGQMSSGGSCRLSLCPIPFFLASPSLFSSRHSDLCTGLLQDDPFPSLLPLFLTSVLWLVRSSLCPAQHKQEEGLLNHALKYTFLSSFP